MTRITNADLEDKVNLINRLTGNQFDFAIQRAYGRPRLFRDGFGREVSPRLPAGQLNDWLEAYALGIMFSQANALTSTYAR